MNIVAFATTQSIANKYSGAKVTQNEDDKIGYIEKGWQIVNWSYNLLKYFKKPHTDTPGWNSTPPHYC